MKNTYIKILTFSIAILLVLVALTIYKVKYIPKEPVNINGHFVTSIDSYNKVKEISFYKLENEFYYYNQIDSHTEIGTFKEKENGIFILTSQSFDNVEIQLIDDEFELIINKKICTFKKNNTVAIFKNYPDK